MDVIRVHGDDRRLTCVRFADNAIGFRTLVRLVQGWPTIAAVHATYGFPFLTDAALRFAFRGYEFTIDSPFGEYCLQPIATTCPSNVFEEIVDHLQHAKVFGIGRWI